MRSGDERAALLLAVIQRSFPDDEVRLETTQAEERPARQQKTISAIATRSGIL